MEALIEGWRNVWGHDIPFYFVQIAPWSGYGAGALPPLWEAQVASLKIPHTGMAVTTDLVHNINDIHPNNKKDVGNRLALWALAKDYGKKDLVYSGPLYKSMKVEGDKIRLQFAHVGGGLKSRDDKPLSEFEIAAADGKFVAAEAVIDGDTRRRPGQGSRMHRPRSASAGGMSRIPTWSTRRACPARRSRRRTGRRARGVTAICRCRGCIAIGVCRLNCDAMPWFGSKFDDSPYVINSVQCSVFSVQ